MAAAPLVATYLGEFGADVIKVEDPRHGDPIRGWGNQREDVGLMWKSLSRNKRAITLDLRCAEGQALVRRLVEHADVVIFNTRPQTLRKWGLDYENLRAVNDRIVMLHITGYGLTGPKSERPGFGTLGEAMSGFAHITGPAGGPPTLPPFMLADGVASLNATYAVMMALYHRDVHGAPGQLIDVNLIDPLARLLEQTLLGYDQLGLVPERAGKMPNEFNRIAIGLLLLKVLCGSRTYRERGGVTRGKTFATPPMLSASRRARSRAGVSLLLRADCEQRNEGGLADLAGEVTRTEWRGSLGGSWPGEGRPHGAAG